ncbi:DNA-binding transcriptional regulator, XRE-family HTH domain [Arboricoccus pini]|uniref:DNA-binding transcriptional regulator, XRE-family HTH domain n=1 Tax=Arboricoccus pini TaxID=1963835 RepID=A0A212R9N0_9PROT|nr:helix-turn-helix transcriptional regulator [Arboricoccus pini]SNB68864.1 DNA-binding transcriptional regulator, XRE-family HTH domain [Arboricoccus pini]
MSQQALMPSQCRAARGLLAWTQDLLAARAGVSRSTVRDFENGRHDLHRSTASQIARTLEEAGVMLIASGEFGPGVRLRRPFEPALAAAAPPEP